MFIVDSSIGLVFNAENEKLLFLNVYFPCDKQTADALHDYRCMLAKLKVVIDEHNFTSLLIVGDFNADPTKGRFWKELNNFMQSLSLIVLHDSLPNDTFTYLCPARNSTSWLDHVVCSKQVIEKVANLRVDYNGAIYDHFPLCFEYSFQAEHVFVKKKGIQIETMVNWNKINEKDKIDISHKIDDLIKQSCCIDNELLYCTNINCKDPKHLENIDKIFDFLKVVLFSSTEDYLFDNTKSFKAVPGWNDYVRDLYVTARKKFLK